MKRKGAKVYVLDSFAVVAYLGRESAAPVVRDLLRQARRKDVELWLSLINYGETLYIIERERGLQGVHQVIGIIDQLPITVAEIDRSMTFLAAHLKAKYPVSYADAFSAALAKIKGGEVLTGDPEFESVESEVPIHWLPR